MVDFELRRYQEEGKEWLKQGLRESINKYLMDEPGLGKTIQAVKAFYEGVDEIRERSLGVDKGFTQAIFCVPNSVLYFWVEELVRNIPERWEVLVVPVTGSKEERRKRWTVRGSGSGSGITIYVCNYSVLRIDYEQLKTAQWSFFLFDEAHKLSNRRTKIYKAVKDLITFSKCPVWMLSGTPVRRGAQDLWGNLSLLDREKFSSYWRFVRTWMICEDTPYGREIIGLKPDHILNFKILIKPYSLRRKKDLLGTTKSRGQLPVMMEDEQHRIYKQLEQKMIAEYTTEVEVEKKREEEKRERFLITRNTLEKLIRLRQLVICPGFFRSQLA